MSVQACWGNRQLSLSAAIFDLSATVDAVAEQLGVPARRARDAADKAAELAEVGAAR